MNPFLIETNRLQIRGMQPSDATAFHFYRSNPEVAKYQSFDPMTREEADAFIERQQKKLFGKPGEWVQYAIADKATSELIGDCAIKLGEDDARIAEVGITLSHTQQKKGFAREAFIGIIEFLFSLPDFHRIVETVDAENVNSIRLLESVGFRKEGHFIENVFFKGSWGSECQYALLRKEWELLSANKKQQ